MNTVSSCLIEVSEILFQIKEMKDQTLDLFFEDKKRARELLIDLNDLEEDTNKLINDLESIL